MPKDLSPRAIVRVKAIVPVLEARGLAIIGQAFFGPADALLAA